MAVLGSCAWDSQVQWQRFAGSAKFDRFVLWDSVSWSAFSQASWDSLRLFVTNHAMKKAWLVFHFLDCEKLSSILSDNDQTLMCQGMGIKRVRKALGSVSEFSCEISRGSGSQSIMLPCVSASQLRQHWQDAGWINLNLLGRPDLLDAIRASNTALDSGQVLRQGHVAVFDGSRASQIEQLCSLYTTLVLEFPGP
jgi:hypothetical protein